MHSASVVQLLVLASAWPTTLPAAQPQGVDSLRRLSAVIVVADSEIPSTISRERLTEIAIDEAAAGRVKLVLFDLATALHLPDTLLVLKVALGPNRAHHSIDAKWLVPPALFARGTRHTQHPLRLACMRGLSGSTSHAEGMSNETVRNHHEEAWRNVVRQAFACLIHET